MDTSVTHDLERKRFEISIDGYIAYLLYDIHDSALDVLSTFVPEQLRGRGVAGKLVAAAYLYADSQDLARQAKCSYARKWLEHNGLA
ncbi:MAG: N-acetyltransferase [Bacteroidales bacterium]|nr:N-acetyltransferase [Bacteroidales bacterium]MBQ6689167.1 N-acetyltransferase [Bacteroidales bacterium]